MPVFDDIWQSVPVDRPLDERALRFALEALATLRDGDGPLRVLDLGCGDGRYSAELAAAGYDLTGVDPSSEALERAAKAHPELKLDSPEADGRLAVADGSFDAVVCINVLEHVADTQMLLSEARRALVPGGHLVVGVPWHGRLKNVLIALGSFERHHDPLQPVLRFYTPGSLRTLLQELGFERVRLRGTGGIPLAHETLLAQAQRG
jgi:2-polyprenyl-6-hydroxyphenyl methylase/3-demethylubiquinone-9 3-methyltransferase